MKKILITFVLGVVCCVAQASHPDFQDEKKQLEFFNLYRQYLNSFSKGDKDELDFLEGLRQGFTPDVFKPIVPHLVLLRSTKF